jgi:hypothetical protein
VTASDKDGRCLRGQGYGQAWADGPVTECSVTVTYPRLESHGLAVGSQPHPQLLDVRVFAENSSLTREHLGTVQCIALPLSHHRRWRRPRAPRSSVCTTTSLTTCAPTPQATCPTLPACRCCTARGRSWAGGLNWRSTTVLSAAGGHRVWISTICASCLLSTPLVMIRWSHASCWGCNRV